MRRQATFAVELVNLATPGERQSHPYEPAKGRTLRRRFSEHLSPPWSAMLADVPKAGARLTRVANALRAAFTAQTPAEAAAVLNVLMRRYRTRPYLTDDFDEPFHLHFHGHGLTAVESLAGELAVGLALMMDTYGQKRFGVCEAHACDRVYADFTRNGSRCYCSDACSARSKMAAYRRRQAGEE
ncbi:CGNR zinc finger domain-containing protein [Pendulispora albinea]|uniref:CGNR zinc finger domain-containing protein n=1 Tax=Pendulispora albinea TaxID=2741071 RepID=A0ABZ2MAE2_9BACT